ncbi:MAG TPA: diguanylate cyclase [Pyrinomonadaceae bacterium]|jgi:diguanylate cyclase (GGDEF)-like protein
MPVIERLGRRSKSFLLTLGFLLVVLQGLINYLAGPDLSFELFYLLTVSLVAWLVGRRLGVIMAVASALAYSVTEYLFFEHVAARPWLPYANAATRLGAFLFVAYFISALRRSLEHERELARTDDLTGLLNRRSFMETAGHELNRARRFRHPFTVVYMDVDDFKEVNDRFGHTTGDAVLRTVGQTIRANLRDVDVIARLGGDEFVILMPETDEAAAAAVVARVRGQIAAEVARARWPIGFSIGVVTWTTPPRTVDFMLKQADDAMYAVKNDGKNRVAHLKLSGEPVPAN